MDKQLSTQDRLVRAALLERLKQRHSVAPAVSAKATAIGRTERNKPLEASWSQQRLWFLAQLDPAASLAYHIPAGLRLTGRLDRAILRATLDRIVARHEILRTTFGRSEDGRPLQVIAAADQGFLLAEHDLRGLDNAEQQAQLAALTHAEARAPFDLAVGPLIRGRLLQLADDQHVLLLTQHHIVADGWSFSVLIQEVNALYAALSQGLPDPLPDLPIQYADYAAWQHQWLDGPALEPQLEFWRSHLHGAPALLELPTDRPRPPAQSYRGGSVALTLSAPLTSGLRALAQRHGATLFMTLLTGWAVLLSRLSGQHDVVVGTPVANRRHAELESLIGFFVNTMALRVNVADDPGVDELMARVRAFMLDAYAHQDVPFEQVVEAVQPARSLGHNPLFQAMLALNNTSARSLSLPGLELAAYDIPRTTTQCDLTLSLTESGDGIEGLLEYASDLFDAATIERLAEQFQVLLQGMVDDDTQRVSRLPLLSTAERERILVSFNRTARAFPHEALIHQLFEEQVRLQPDAIAVIHEAHSISYAALNERANQIAHHLVGLGLRPDDRVAICVERSIDMVAGLLGILKAGACYVPLDPAYPTERLTHMLRDSAPAALLTQRTLLDALPQHAVPVLLLDDPDAVAMLRAYPAHNPDPLTLGLSSRNLAYVIYTSGSTGTPKGVMVEHRSVNRLVINSGYAEIGPGDVVAHCANPAFDAATWEVWGALLNGAKLVAVPHQVTLDPKALGHVLTETKVSSLWLTVGLFNAYLDVLGPVFSQLKHLLIGGDALDPTSVARLFERGDVPLHLLNGYGPTEATTFTTTYKIGATALDLRSIPIGRPIANTQVYLLDRRGQPVPIGVTGEIHIGGVGLARGYLGQPELTAQRFIADPFGDTPHARLYKTGDLGRWLPDGTIEYLGRNDFQVKLRGFRIELGEIESHLRACPGVRDAVVIAREDQPGDKRLVAYLLAINDAPLAAAALRDQLATRLPDYMVPSAFVTLDAFPLTPNGKLDRHALPAPDASAIATREYAAPQGEIETTIAQIWQSLLGIERVGRHDDFFDLGGHSLLAVQMVSRLRQALGVEIALRELFVQTTLSAHARLIETATAASATAIGRTERNKPLEASWSQQRLWFLAQLDPAASLAYHIPAGLRLTGRLDRAVLRATLDRIVARHEILRTTFGRSEDGRPLQVIAAADQGFLLAEHDLRGLDNAEQQAQLAALTHAEARAPFDLAVGPLIRGRLLQLADDQHVLLLTQHHIVADGWSFSVLIQEVNALYAALSQGLPDPLPDLPIQYADYAAWQHQWLDGPALEPQLEFWRSHLHGAPALLELPTDRPRPPAQSYRGGSVALTLSAPLTSGLRALAQRHGATLFMTLLTGWAVLLSRLSGQHDVVVGTPVANRRHAELESLIGFFVNTMALRVNVADDPGVDELMARVRAFMLDAYAHQDVPFEQVVEAVQPARSLGHNPLFQAMLALNNTSARSLSLPGLELAAYDIPRTTTQCDLTLSLTESGDGIEGLLEYASDLFDAATIERLAEQFQVLLQGMVDDDTQRVSRLPLLSTAERERILVSFNRTARAFPHEALIHQLFEEQVRLQPDAIAVIHEAHSISYAALNERANQIAHHLVGLGLRPDDRVAICVERSIDMVAGLLGILKAGACYVPLDPAYPTERLTHMLRDSAPAALLTQRTLLDALPQHAVPVLLLDDPDAVAMLRAYPAHNPDPLALGLSSHNLAYVIYTSGSTGTPKGVMNPHVGVVNRLLWGQHEYPLTSKDRVLQKTPFSFDPSVFEFFWPLLAGGQLVMARPGAHQDIDYLTQTLEQYGITVIHFVSSMLPLFIEKAKQQPLTTLERVIVGGDTLPYPVQQQFHTHLPDVMLLNLYGPTETAIEVTHWQCRPDSHIGTVPIGYPIANTQIYIVDQHMQPVPVNVVGEIYIGGIQVSRGYLNRPDLTAERFVPDSFIQEPGRRLYRTGDLGRWLPDGAIEYLGRNDFQVKIRGLRIELGEIETRLAECAGVQQCVVLVREDRQGDKRLVAYYVPQEGAAPSASALRAQLAEKLTEHMVPSAFVCLDALPFTPNGKLDRQRLPVPDLTSVATQVYVSPEGKTEQAVVQVWQNLLALERVGREDHFFELGGHSLLAIQVVSRLNELLDADIPLSELFTHPIVKNFAAAADRAPRARPSPIVPVDRSRPLPLSWAQQRLWFLDQLDHSISVAYHMSEGLRLRGHLDRAALQATFDRIVARHENLRTTFISSSDEPVQRIAPADVGFALQEEDLRALSEAERAYVIGQRCEAEVIQPFDLSEGPLMRARLLRLQDDDHLLLITQHHIVSDGWSVGLLIQEVIALYTAFCQGKQDPLPPLPIQYADYAAWQQQWLQGDVLQRQIDFWKDYLAGAPTLLQLPADRPRPAIQRHVGSRLPFALDAKTTAGLHSLSTRHGTTLFMTLLAGWAILLSRVSGQDDVVVGTPVANRQRAEIESLIGFFVNALALRVKLDGDPNVADLLARVKESSVAAYAHQDLPFEQVVEALQPPRSLSHNPLFQANLTLENVPTEQKLTLPGLDVETVELPHLTTQFDLALHLMERDDVIEGRFYYSSDLFDAATIERLAEQFQVLLQGMVDDDTQRVSRLPLLSTAERERILVSFNRTARAFPHEALIHQLFEEQVRLQPDAIAVIHEAHSISYAALNERANQIAHHLVGLGLRHDDRVAICVERSIDMVAGLLGILKAGACYVPLDPAYPAERLSHMLRDSAPAALLTQRALLDALPQHTVPVLLLDDPDAAAMLRAYPAHNPDPLTLGLSSHNLAYVIYTSGSTGTPKGVMVEHRGVLNLWLALENTVFGEVPDAMRVGQNAALSFDASVQAFLQLLSGRTMVLFPQAIRRDSAAFLEYLRKHKVEAFDCTPSQLEFLINDGVLGQDALNPKVILIGGEAIGDELWQRLASLRSTRVYNLYGPTECTVESVIAHVSRDGRKPHIGRPIANTQVYLLDGQGQPVPIGVTGEIHIGGVGLARGYLGQPELTAQRFIADPFGGTPHARLYKTGDLGRWLPDGTIEYLGRNDFQVKLRGFRIELGEIESQLRACPGVRDAVVIAREDQPGDKRLVAYLLAINDAPLAAAALRDQLATRLPDYMVPSAFVTLDAFPLTPNGKLDRHALPAPDASAIATREYAAPQGEIETTIAQIWQSLLGIERVGRHDDFFDLGGYSLTAIQVVGRIREQFGLTLPLAKVFQTPTIAALGEVIFNDQVARFDNDEIERLSAEIEQLSEDQLRALLN